jgi:3D (Asp-Asp-Asp) domain-containing protein
MLMSTICRSRKFGTVLLFLALLGALGTMDSRTASRHAYSAAAAPADDVLGQPPASAASDSRTEHPAKETVAQRLAKIKSKQELIEKNKRFPMLHEDTSQFLGSEEVVATGYYAGKESTGKSPGHPQYGITSSGVRVKMGVLSTIAADPNVFPMGTILYIPGYGYGIVADTGSAIKGKKIDLYFETKDQIYKEWGKRTVRVFIVKRGDGRVSEEMLQRWDDVLSVAASLDSSSALVL